jgi:anti-sigma-K factor RskA
MNHDENNLAGLTLGQHYEPEDLLLYVLEMLTPDERQAVEAHLESTGGGCAQCRQELAAVREEMGVYAAASVESAGLASPPASSRDRLLAQAAREGSTVKASVVTPPAQPQMELISGGKPAGRSLGATNATRWLGWGVAAAIAIAAVHFYQDRETLRGTLSAQALQIAQLSADQARAREVVAALTDSSAQRVTLTLTKAPPPPQPTGRATYLAKQGTLIFLASHLDQLPAGKTYELWVIPASGAAPVPAGTFRPDERGNANVVTAKLQGTGAAKAFGITIEPSGGSSTPTMPIVLAGS